MKIQIEVPNGIVCTGCIYLRSAKNRPRDGKPTRWCHIFQTPIQVNADNRFIKTARCIKAGEKNEG